MDIHKFTIRQIIPVRQFPIEVQPSRGHQFHFTNALCCCNLRQMLDFKAVFATECIILADKSEM